MSRILNRWCKLVRPYDFLFVACIILSYATFLVSNSFSFGPLVAEGVPSACGFVALFFLGFRSINLRDQAFLLVVIYTSIMIFINLIDIFLQKEPFIVLLLSFPYLAALVFFGFNRESNFVDPHGYVKLTVVTCGVVSSAIAILQFLGFF